MSSDFLICDASMIRDFLKCREFFRRRWVENIVPKKKSIHLEYGRAVHAGVEHFWREGTYEDAMRKAVECTNSVDQSLWNVRERERWQELCDTIPDMLGCYFDKAVFRDMLFVEKEISSSKNGVVLAGRIDLMDTDGTVYDVKTASEFGPNWKENKKSELLRDIQLPLYDYILSELGYSLAFPVVEVLVKPYKGKPPRLERVELPEIPVWRGRFCAQLDYILQEMLHFVRTHSETKPWPMSATACVSKYGPCDYIDLCNYGDSEATLGKFVPRIEHLEVRK